MFFEEKIEGGNSSDVKNEDLSRKLDFFREYGFSIFRIVYKGVIDVFFFSFNFRKKFFEIVEVIDLVYFEEMRNEIMVDMRRDFL